MTQGVRCSSHPRQRKTFLRGTGGLLFGWWHREVLCGGGMLNLAFQGQRRWEGSARGLEGIERVALEERVRDSEIS